MKRTALRRRSIRPKAKREQLADDLWSQVVRSRGRCDRCGSPRNLAAHHIIRRGHDCLRWNLLNGVCLCPVDHADAHSHRDQFREWVDDDWPDRIRELLELDRLRPKVDIEAVIEELRGAA